MRDAIPVAILSAVLSVLWGIPEPQDAGGDPQPRPRAAARPRPALAAQPVAARTSGPDRHRATATVALSAMESRADALAEAVDALGTAAEGSESLPREDWYGEQRNPLQRGIEDHGPHYLESLKALNATHAERDPERRAQAIRAVGDAYPGTYLGLTAQLMLAEGALRAGDPVAALARVDEELEAVPPEIAGNRLVAAQVNLFRGIALASSGDHKQANELLERVMDADGDGEKFAALKQKAQHFLLELAYVQHEASARPTTPHP